MEAVMLAVKVVSCWSQPCWLEVWNGDGNYSLRFIPGSYIDTSSRLDITCRKGTWI